MFVNETKETTRLACSCCGAAVPEDSHFCVQCGAILGADTQSFEGEASRLDGVPNKKAVLTARGKFLLIVLSTSLVLALIAGGIGLYTRHQRTQHFHDLLRREWSRVEKGNSYYTLILDVSEDSIEYRFEGFPIYKTIATYKYEVLSEDTIRILGADSVHTVWLSADRDIMVIKPSFTNTEKSDRWYSID